MINLTRLRQGIPPPTPSSSDETDPITEFGSQLMVPAPAPAHRLLVESSKGPPTEARDAPAFDGKRRSDAALKPLVILVDDLKLGAEWRL